MTDRTTTGAYGAHADGYPTDPTPGPLGAAWQIRRSLTPAPGNTFHPPAEDWLDLGDAHAEAVTINGVTYSGRIDYGYRLSDGARAHRLDTYRGWHRIGPDGRVLAYGTTDAARERLAEAAAELAAHFPDPTPAEIRDAVARWARRAARAGIGDLLHRTARGINEGAAVPIGYGPTVAAAIRAEWRRLLLADPAAQRAAGDYGDGWGRLSLVDSLGAQHSDPAAETPERADAEARADAQARAEATATRAAARYGRR